MRPFTRGCSYVNALFPLLSMCVSSFQTQDLLKAAEAPIASTIDYAYFDGPPGRQTVVVVGVNFAMEPTNESDCQTRKCSQNVTSEWHNAIRITRAEEDLYRFKSADDSTFLGNVEVRVKGAEGKYTEPV